jgi:ADP-ribose pyrophosphatase
MVKETIKESRMVHTGRYLKVRVDRVKVGSGEHVYDLVLHPGAVAILPVTPDGRILLEKQYRHALGQTILEIPAGTLEEGETPEDCAKRELMEETGYRPTHLIKLGVVYTAPGYSNERIHLFYAKVIKEKGGPAPEPDETITVGSYTMSHVSSMVRRGLLLDSKSLSALFIAERLGLVRL